MKQVGNFQITGDLKARNFPQDVKDFYGITVKQVKNNVDVHSYRGINLISFDGDNFYVSQNFPNTDEVLVSGKASGSGGGVTDHGALTGLTPDDDHPQYALTDRTRPTTWPINISDGTNSYLDDTINFNPSDFYITSSSVGDPVVNIQGKSIGVAGLSAVQTTIVAAGDHIAWNSLIFAVGNNISIDTTTTYTSSAGASVGRFTLQPGRIYDVSTGMNITFSGNTGDISFGIRDDSGNTPPGAIPNGARIFTVTNAGNVGSNSVTIAVLAPTVATRYEVRILSSVAVTNIGTNSFLRIVEL